jgi:UDP-GlcNAc:undecaprenyl-phosphate/decaprenyl-phosphate GlcNAc-1-phosphate transferase
MKDDALLGFLLALVVATLLTPLVAKLARRVGAVDAVKERGLARAATPLLGGLAIFSAVLVAASRRSCSRR